MFERYGNEAKHAIVLAEREALDHGHEFIGTEHLLLGLAGAGGVAHQMLGEHGVGLPQAREAAARGWARDGVTGTSVRDTTDALASLGIDLAHVRQRAEEAFGPGRFTYPRPSFTRPAVAALTRTLSAARDLGTESVGTGHLLLGLLDDAQGTATRLLADLRVDTGELTAAARTRAALGE